MISGFCAENFRSKQSHFLKLKRHPKTSQIRSVRQHHSAFPLSPPRCQIRHSCPPADMTLTEALFASSHRTMRRLQRRSCRCSLCLFPLDTTQPACCAALRSAHAQAQVYAGAAADAERQAQKSRHPPPPPLHASPAMRAHESAGARARQRGRGLGGGGPAGGAEAGQGRPRGGDGPLPYGPPRPAPPHPDPPHPNSWPLVVGFEGGTEVRAVLHGPQCTPCSVLAVRTFAQQGTSIQCIGLVKKSAWRMELLKEDHIRTEHPPQHRRHPILGSSSSASPQGAAAA